MSVEIDISRVEQSCFLVTGGAGFIGSNIVEQLMSYEPKMVRVIDDFSSGFYKNINKYVGCQNFEFVQGDIRDFDLCSKVIAGIDFVSHQAALGSVSRSIINPFLTNDVNVNGFLNVLTCAKNAAVKGMVYASSSSVYGSSKELPKFEDKIGKPLSPYAVSKLTNELYAAAFAEVYSFYTVGMRYFNVFGPRQDPNSQYSAVIPLFMKAAIEGNAPLIYGDGLQSRDFTYIDNVVQVNIKSMFACESLRSSRIYNVAVGETTSLLELWDIIAEMAGSALRPTHGNARVGDVRNSLADISLAMTELDYKPKKELRAALEKTFNWYKENY